MYGNPPGSGSGPALKLNGAIALPAFAMMLLAFFGLWAILFGWRSRGLLRS